MWLQKNFCCHYSSDNQDVRYNKDIWRRGYDLLCGNVEKNLNIGSCSRCIDTDYCVTTVSFGKSEISTTELAKSNYACLVESAM